MLSFFRRSKPVPADGPVPEGFIVLQGLSDGIPDIRIVNQALDTWGGRGRFGWHLSVIIEMAEQYDNGLPTHDEVQALTGVANTFKRGLREGENATLLASVTHGGARQLVYRVADPDVASAWLDEAMAAPVREFEYLIEHDPAWALAEIQLAPGRGAGRQ